MEKFLSLLLVTIIVLIISFLNYDFYNTKRNYYRCTNIQTEKSLKLINTLTFQELNKSIKDFKLKYQCQVFSYTKHEAAFNNNH